MFKFFDTHNYNCLKVLKIVFTPKRLSKLDNWNFQTKNTGCSYSQCVCRETKQFGGISQKDVVGFEHALDNVEVSGGIVDG